MMHTTLSKERRKRKKCSVYAWGGNGDAQLGLGVAGNQYEPQLVQETLTKGKVVYIASGSHHNCAITKNGLIYSWGKGEEGQLGLGNTSKGYIAQKVPLKKKASIVACGGKFSAAIIEDKAGSVYTWGQSSNLQIGSEESPSPDYVPSPFRLSFFSRRTVISIGVGLSHVACVVANADGDTDVYTWGDGSKGKLGNNSENAQSTPYLVESLRGARSLQIGCGSDFTVMLSSRGDVYTWGSGDSGRTGTGTVESVFVPVCLPTFGQVNITEIAIGFDHAAAVSEEGKLYTWGYGSNGRLGHGEEVDLLVPTMIESISSEKFVHASCGGCHTAAVTENGLLYTFGWNHFGQLGLGPPCFGGDDKEMEPKIVEALRSVAVLQVSCGEQHTIALVV